MAVEAPSNKLITIVAHVMMWALFGIAMFFYHPLFSGLHIPLRSWIIQSFTLFVLIVVFYFNTYFLVPQLLLKNRVVYYICCVVSIVIITAFMVGWSDRALQLIQRHWRGDDYRKLIPAPSERTRRLDRPTIILTALVLGLGTSVAVIQSWQKDKEKREELEKEKIATELSFLKAQINPHFFFNTLNNIYALTAIDPPLAGKAIHQLSRMMRYLLDGMQPGQTMLSQEISFIKDYMSLMQLRLTDVVSLHVHIPDNLTDVPVAPMLMLPYVENAFKHGVTTSGLSQIHVLIGQRNNLLELEVRNTVFEEKNIGGPAHQGIGLQNTKRRLELLYPGKHKLDISKDREYTVHLTLDLS